MTYLIISVDFHETYTLFRVRAWKKKQVFVSLNLYMGQLGIKQSNSSVKAGTFQGIEGGMVRVKVLRKLSWDGWRGIRVDKCSLSIPEGAKFTLLLISFNIEMDLFVCQETNICLGQLWQKTMKLMRSSDDRNCS